MTDNQKTWSVLGLVVAMLLLILWLFEKNKKKTTPKQTTQTQATVTLSGGVTGQYQYPTRDENNVPLVRLCHYSNGHILSLDPGATGGQCPPVFTDLAGEPGYLEFDEVVALPNAGQSTTTAQTLEGGA